MDPRDHLLTHVCSSTGPCVGKLAHLSGSRPLDTRNHTAKRVLWHESNETCHKYEWLFESEWVSDTNGARLWEQHFSWLSTHSFSYIFLASCPVMPQITTVGRLKLSKWRKFLFFFVNHERRRFVVLSQDYALTQKPCWPRFHKKIVVVIVPIYSVHTAQVF